MHPTSLPYFLSTSLIYRLGLGFGLGLELGLGLLLVHHCVGCGMVKIRVRVSIR